ncbi:MAG: hypothetical protein AAGN35_06745 [Bacteroidota bacterium]
MNKAFLLICLLFAAQFTFAQAEKKADTPRDLICEMSKINIPKVANLKLFCTRISALFPSPQTIATYPIKKKLYYNKLSGVLKRGSGWDRMSPQQRATLAESTMGYIKSYLGYEPGAAIEAPAESKQKGDDCLLRGLKYASVEACHADAEYVVLGDITDNSRTKVERFWDCLKYICRLLDCNLNHPG